MCVSNNEHIIFSIIINDNSPLTIFPAAALSYPSVFLALFTNLHFGAVSLITNLEDEEEDGLVGGGDDEGEVGNMSGCCVVLFDDGRDCDMSIVGVCCFVAEAVVAVVGLLVDELVAPSSDNVEG